METQCIKKGEVLQFNITTLKKRNNTITWESYQRIQHNNPDFIRVILKNQNKIIFEKRYKPVINQECWGFINCLCNNEDYSDQKIKEIIQNKLQCKENDIIEFHLIKQNIYANPDECNSKQWIAICTINSHFLNELEKNERYLVVDMKDSKYLFNFEKTSIILFDEEVFTFLFHSFYLGFEQ
ncbi:hypothetical protein EHI8A_050540 [Entamoeba histolytica HM-1:IMSS-B]|uniref:Nudix hydrolase domain-containing protein n=6 Tax=Entamoeba histolytica TaxID=5759 RepID=C4LTD6_ENTH1|nr:hypothetical protein EHI_045230 [Entamoeba histolytica HM-1:IMSS]EMD44270.1 Hypothetical protein EHI5A_085040 [Entamoeba histolytica KU27]EMH77879.1 hypothetical protein EHI8A_050540 [Entamoeba histolytica HM-1:IMSS-B]EMS13991.1 hypothetical protein KM1_109250 [Entamoeba histolytica HM-3:IMSS]ENY65641.1 hypothetical protein EHI7A_050190 [Entamoeba histolytica HM-1:IMSS-A]GAT91820.1 hypothetical protein CL6EHI_045230 [Entamoeba histolytica]|eukprot:XP_657318.1 hypothetical protein EHI_045230 [Entamoeba histolytica HM-1:IMSS]